MLRCYVFMKLKTSLHACAFFLLSLVHFAGAQPVNAQCDSLDFSILCTEGDLVNDAVFSCGFDCIFAGDLQGCFANCISAGIPTMSTGCVGCFAEQSVCAQNNCLLVCGFGSAADCEACVLANCQSEFENCAGILDADGDGETTVCDCDDNNAAVYPGAPANSSGVDNNCDGVLSAEEAACPLDLTGDLLISVSDVLLVLSDFGCLEGCLADVNGDGAVTVSDVLLLLSSFGTDC